MSQTGVSDAQKKLKAAIRVKLEELGVYVDDELPEYIMVMIANKKDKSSMKEDLNLFIGKHTGKFCDWLFEIFDKLHSATSGSKKKDDDREEREKKDKEERRKKEEKEREREKEERRRAEKEKEERRRKEREREERDRVEKERERERRKREEERSRRVAKEKASRRRSRSRTWSEDEFESKIRQKPAPKIIPIGPADDDDDDEEDDERLKQVVSSTVVVKRNIRTVVGDAKGSKGRQAMFMKALNEASVSTGYGSKRSEQEPEIYQGDDHAEPPVKRKIEGSRLAALQGRVTRIGNRNVEHGDGRNDDDEDTVVVGREQKQGPSITVTLKGGEKWLNGQSRIVVGAIDAVKKNQSVESRKRKVIEAPETRNEEDEPKKKHQTITYDLSPAAIRRSDTSSTDSALRKKWDGQIDLNDPDTSDEEAEIDAVLAATRKTLLQGKETEVMPPTSLLSGAMNMGLYNPMESSYIPTPLSVLQQQTVDYNQERPESQRLEKCKFWPTCNRAEACQYHHPVKNCTNFPNCSFGQRCLFIHPACKFDRACSKPNCPFTHYGKAPTVGLGAGGGLPITGNRPTAQVVPISQPTVAKHPVQPKTTTSIAGLLTRIKDISSGRKSPPAPSVVKPAEDAKENTKKVEIKQEETPENKEKVVEVKTESTEAVVPPSAPPKAVTAAPTILCKFSGGCKNPVCKFKHPKECRFGANCANRSCYFYHKPGDRPAPITTAPDSSKYKWKPSEKA